MSLLVAERSRGLRGHIRVPGDKSISHRALILAAMAEGRSRIMGLSDAEDVVRTRRAIEALGATVEDQPDGGVIVAGGAWRAPTETIDCGNSGTSARLLAGAVAGRAVSARLDGDESLRKRPMERILAPLRVMGARIAEERLPLTIHGGDLRGIDHRSPIASAQLKSAILLAGLGAEGPVSVTAPPSRDHSERMLRQFGVDIHVCRNDEVETVSLGARRVLTASTIDVPGDLSSAAFPLVAALMCDESAVTATQVGINSGRTGLLDTLIQMGVSLDINSSCEQSGEPVGDIAARFSRLAAVTVSADRAPTMIDEYPILAVAAACAEGETIMHGLGELRYKESDRLATLVSGLTACGVACAVEGDTLRVRGGAVPGGVIVETHGDHRIAMAFLVLGLVSERPIRVDGAEMIATSFPGFVDMMRGIGARIGAP